MSNHDPLNPEPSQCAACGVKNALEDRTDEWGDTYTICTTEGCSYDQHLGAMADAMRAEKAAAKPPRHTASDGEFYPLTDYGNAQRFSKQHGDDLRWCEETGKWLIWSGERWATDRTGEVMRRAKQTARSIYEEASAQEDKSARKRLADHAKASESATRLKAMIDLAKSEPSIPVTVEQLDTDPFKLNVLNGTLDLRDGTFSKHRRSDLITKLAPIEYDPNATCPHYDAVMDRSMAGNTELIRYIDRLGGLCLTGDIRHHILPIFWGDGQNGKSTIIDLWVWMLGDYASWAPESLMTTRSGDEHPTEVADLCGKRLVVASETDEGKKLRIGMVKRLTGDAVLKGRYMRRDYFSFTRTHKSILVTNNKPRITEDSAAIWRRVKLIPFTVEIPEEEQDAALPEKLRDEAAGVLARLVRGCQDWRDNGYDLCEPAVVARATDEYRHDEDPLTEFVEQHCHFADWATVTRKELWDAYQRYAQNAGIRHPLGKQGLYGRMRKLEGVQEGYDRSHGKTQRVFKGIGLAFNGSMTNVS